ncbi:transposase [Candidatus Collierbacteria bacterium]|nr:transposase [Candidatus Collierbacteria bacterium]
MPVRKVPLVTGEYYHVLNRGNTHQPVFLDKRDYDRFLLNLVYYKAANPPFKLSRLLQIPIQDRNSIMQKLVHKSETLVDVISYCLMPNHFHLLLKQNLDEGISNYLRLIINSYVRYFNTKYQNKGSLLQGVFRAVLVETND